MRLLEEMRVLQTTYKLITKKRDNIVLRSLLNINNINNNFGNDYNVEICK
jgi:hypothetical protein